MSESMPPAPMGDEPAAQEPMAPPPAAPAMAPPPMAPPPMAAAPAGRPTGATVIAIIDGILGVLALLAGLLVMVGMSVIGGIAGAAGDEQGVPGLGGIFAGLGIFFGIIIIVIGALYLAVAYGVWNRRGWSWMLGAVISVIALIFGVLGLTGGVSVAQIVSIGLPAIVLYYLWQPDVKAWLGRA